MRIAKIPIFYTAFRAKLRAIKLQFYSGKKGGALNPTDL